MKKKVALRQIRRERKKIERKPNRFDEYRDHYSAVFDGIKEVGGQEAMNELVEWTTSETKRAKRLPTPTAVRRRAVEICEKRGHSIPDGSILNDLDTP